MSVTQKQIAAQLGVSNQLVSYALNGTGTVSEAMRERIMVTAQQMGYQPNGVARAMKSGRFGCVAMLLSTRPYNSTLPMEVLEGIHDELAAQDYHLSFFRLPDQQLTDAEKMPKILREWMADGMIVDYTHAVPTRLIELVDANRMPAVWFNTLREFDCVRPDDYGAGRAITRRLIEMGHRRVLYVDHMPHGQRREGYAVHYSVAERARGYRDEMAAHDLEPRCCLGEPLASYEKRNALLKPALRQMMRHERPTAVIAQGGFSLQCAYAIAAENSWRVPTDLSIASFSQTDHLEYATIEQTLMAQQLAPMGRELVKMLLQKIETPSLKLPTRTLPFVFVPGTSVAPPNSNL